MSLEIAACGRRPSAEEETSTPPSAELQPPAFRFATVDTVGDDGRPLLFTCELTGFSEELADIGLSAEDLRRPRACVVGDFDGNGEQDVAVWGELAGNTRRFQVFFFEGGQLLLRQQIATPGRDHLWLDPPRVSEDQFGAPVHPFAALVQAGEGGTTYYYIWEAAERRLHRHDTASESR